MGAVKELRAHKEVGTPSAPSTNELKLKSNKFNDAMHPMVDGIEPLKELSCTSKCFAFIKKPRPEGRVFDKELSFIKIVNRAVSFPIDGDMLPTNPFEPKLKEVTSKLNAQVTPVHGVPQILVAGMPPLHDQPVNPTEEGALNAAAMSHIAASFAEGVGEDVGDAVGDADGFGEGRLDGLPEGWPVG